MTRFAVLLDYLNRLFGAKELAKEGWQFVRQISALQQDVFSTVDVDRTSVGKDGQDINFARESDNL